MSYCLVVFFVGRFVCHSTQFAAITSPKPNQARKTNIRQAVTLYEVLKPLAITSEEYIPVLL